MKVKKNDKMTFIEKSVSGMIPRSEEEKKIMRMRETRTRFFMQMELEACRDELDWLIRGCVYAVNDYLEEYCPPIPLPIPPATIKNGKEGANGSEEHLVTYSYNNFDGSLPATSSTAAAQLVSPPSKVQPPVTAAVR